jgi:hypothetical protein
MLQEDALHLVKLLRGMREVNLIPLNEAGGIELPAAFRCCCRTVPAYSDRPLTLTPL